MSPHAHFSLFTQHCAFLNRLFVRPFWREMRRRIPLINAYVLSFQFYFSQTLFREYQNNVCLCRFEIQMTLRLRGRKDWSLCELTAFYTNQMSQTVHFEQNFIKENCGAIYHEITV